MISNCADETLGISATCDSPLRFLGMSLGLVTGDIYGKYLRYSRNGIGSVTVCCARLHSTRFRSEKPECSTEATKIVHCVLARAYGSDKLPKRVSRVVPESLRLAAAVVIKRMYQVG
jgi:hypothetical protein